MNVTKYVKLPMLSERNGLNSLMYKRSCINIDGCNTSVSPSICPCVGMWHVPINLLEPLTQLVIVLYKTEILALTKTPFHFQGCSS